MENKGGAASARLKIVVPTSFTPKSDMALEFALAYSKNLNAEVYIFHAHDQKVVDYRRLDRINEEVTERMRQSVIHAIERLHARGVTHSVEQVHRRMSYGKPWNEILKIAAGINADMIVMGYPKMSEFKGLLAKCPCSVVLVKEKDPEFVVK